MKQNGDLNSQKKITHQSNLWITCTPSQLNISWIADHSYHIKIFIQLCS